MSDVMAEFYDGPHATPPLSDDGAVYLGIKNLTEAGHLDLSQVRHIAEDDFPKWTKRVEPKPGDIVFTYEATLHRYAIIPDGFRGTLGRRIALIRPDLSKIDRRYLHYYLLSPQWRRTIEQRINVGSTVDRIPLTEFPDYPVPLPPLAHQRAVVAALAAIDDLIENNRRRIEILEETARLIYREWFVDFRFPGHEEVECCDSDLGPIPEGWDVSPLEDLQSGIPNATAAGPFGSKLGRKDYVDEPGVPVIRGANLRVGGGFVDEGFVFVSSEKAETLASSLARLGDVVVTQRGTLGQVGLVPESARFEAYVLSQSQMKFTSDDDRVDPLVIYMQLATPEGTRRIQDIATGSGVPHINLSMFREMKFLVPPRSIQRDFVAAVGPMERLRNCLDRQNRTLEGARDLLLPRLISGELDVSEIDLDLDSVA